MLDVQSSSLKPAGSGGEGDLEKKLTIEKVEGPKLKGWKGR
jgi:hypothetical protein